MEITAIQRSGATIIQIVGSLDTLTSDEAQTFFDELFKTDQVHLAADLSQVEYLSSAGLRVLLSALKNARRRSGDLYLAGLQENVQQVLELAGFTSIFKIFPTIEAAIGAFTP
jgi:anti-sigma B factor antagonist